MTARSGILCFAAVHSTPGAYIRSPSDWMLTEKRPRSRLASAAPTEAGGPEPPPEPPERPSHWWCWSIGHRRFGQLLTLPSEATSDQSRPLTALKVSMQRSAGLIGLGSP